MNKQEKRTLLTGLLLLTAFGGILLIGYLIYPVKKGMQHVNYIPWYDWIIMLAGTAAFFYMVVNAHSLTVRLGMAQIKPYEVYIGLVGILALLELCRTDAIALEERDGETSVRLLRAPDTIDN